MSVPIKFKVGRAAIAVSFVALRSSPVDGAQSYARARSRSLGRAGDEEAEPVA